AERQGTQGGAERGRGFRRAIKKSICTSKAIESLNAKLKRETHKRILANSEDNATIITVNVFRSYDKSAGMRSRKKGDKASSCYPLLTQTSCKYHKAFYFHCFNTLIMIKFVSLIYRKHSDEK
ncbi:MAG: hypothetical protein PUJ84_00540, partial [Mollicutes bacterium]|nr:hypothetical protein [Mollicutes bacterium]